MTNHNCPHESQVKQDLERLEKQWNETYQYLLKIQQRATTTNCMVNELINKMQGTEGRVGEE